MMNDTVYSSILLHDFGGASLFILCWRAARTRGGLLWQWSPDLATPETGRSHHGSRLASETSGRASGGVVRPAPNEVFSLRDDESPPRLRYAPLDPAPRFKSAGVQTELMSRKRRWIAWILLGSLAASPLRAWAEEGPVRPSLQQPLASPQRPLASPQGPLPSSQGPKLPIPPGLPRYDLDARLDIADGKSSCASASSSRTGRARRRASWSSTSIPGTRSRTRIGRSCPRRWRSSGSVR